LGEGGGKEEQIPRVIFRCQLEFKFRGENFWRREECKL
jgi:hypothetical protein